jgi:hypothetical protein
MPAKRARRSFWTGITSRDRHRLPGVSAARWIESHAASPQPLTNSVLSMKPRSAELLPPCMHASLLVAATAVVQLLPAQVGVGIEVINPITLAAGPAAGQQTQTIPAGQLGTNATGYATSGSSFASIGLTTGTSPYYASASIFAQANASPAESAMAGPALVVFEFTAPVATPVTLAIKIDHTGSAGIPMPQASVDINADGSYEYFSTLPSQLQPSLTVGPQPLRIAVQFGPEVLQLGFAITEVELRLLPENSLLIDDVYSGCVGGRTLLVEPSLIAQGVLVRNFSVGGPQFTVFGFQSMPVLLPPSAWSFCLLVPSPDVVLPTLPSTTYLNIPLPAAIRPADLWCQSVTLQAGQLLTTNAVRLQAM